MKRIILFLFLAIPCLQLSAQDQNLLSGRYSADSLKMLLIPAGRWTPFPKINDRDGWAKADAPMMKALVKQAESYISYVWPSIPATTSLLIERTGNRSEYENMSFKKREVLGTLVLAEVYENKGRFIDPIINGVWNICEESWWGAPAHLPRTKAYSGLMDVSAPFVE
ncbi:MAG TPA: hypothetical protein VHC50_07855, partial [Puia sp.]|nr:hypothetical protein [Puia sp.]